MNKYGNKYGYQSPNLTELLFNRIQRGSEEFNIEWQDNSWHNDLCDSMHFTIKEEVGVHEYVEIFLPNSVVDDEDKEEFNTFFVTNDEQESLLTTTDVDEVIAFVNEYITTKQNLKK